MKNVQNGLLTQWNLPSLINKHIPRETGGKLDLFYTPQCDFSRSGLFVRIRVSFSLVAVEDIFSTLWRNNMYPVLFSANNRPVYLHAH